ncbi:hypothetical protein NDI56_16255 [Haloarcula sp. S1CR25-12]|uniref:Uncharacterized protein n=1 Tax=Haloarcula saliterrae TaxID=2950534 RepID=A0ABU2FFA8_9EURY|nr:hypothetical protein [Haloarcula sp. S1CR25-12]MDS0260955.1 hypothetical protein [Haloarcula sp. S1CR25-12]
MNTDTETVESYVMDVGCIRKTARDELLEQARVHTRDCAPRAPSTVCAIAHEQRR